MDIHVHGVDCMDDDDCDCDCLVAADDCSSCWIVAMMMPVLPVAGVGVLVGYYCCCCLDANSPLDDATAAAADDVILTDHQRRHSFVPTAAAGPGADDAAWENHQTDNRLG